MHLRRALLLFAIVLGLAAIAASVSRPPEESRERVERPATESGPDDVRTPSASPGSATASAPAAEIRFDAARDQTRRLATGRPASVLVEVDEPGLVEIPDLGLNAPAEPLTPARFELLLSEPNRFEIAFTPATGSEPESAGKLVVRAAEE